MGAGSVAPPAESKSALPEKVRRDPAGVRRRIMDAALREFADNGLEGARIDRIAALANINKRMLYYHVGDKEALYLAVLEEAYAKIRTEERTLDLATLAPPAAIARLLEFTWRYYLDNPEFLALLNTENMQKARYLKTSEKIAHMHSPFVQMIDEVLRRGEQDGSIRFGLDAVQLYISMAGIAYFYLSNSATLGTIFGRDLLTPGAQETRLRHMTALVLDGLRAPALAHRLDRTGGES